MRTNSVTKTQTPESTSDRLTTLLSYGALLLLGYLVFLVTVQFLVPLAWSAVLAIFFYPIHKKFKQQFKPNYAALFSTLVLTFVLVVPTLIIMFFTAKQALSGATKIQQVLTDPSSGGLGQALSWIQAHTPASMQDMDFSDQIQQAAEKAAAFFAGKIGGILKNLFTFFLDLFVMCFGLFFMFRDGPEIVHGIKHLLPFDPAIQDEMVDESGALIFASVAVALVVAGIQGALGGLAFTIAGIPSPAFWAVVIALFSIVPVVGSALIWVPAAAWLAIAGHWGKALVIVAICGGVAGIADNIARPLLLRNRTRLNDLLLFISVLGGIESFGLLGLVLGPTVLAAAMGVFRVYMDHREQALDHAPAK